jgi:hypothetical protein
VKDRWDISEAITKTKRGGCGRNWKIQEIMRMIMKMKRMER